MRALRAVSHGSDCLEVQDVLSPSLLGDDEVRLSTRAVGVCGSDIHAWHGTQTYPMEFPVTLGHEAVGTVVDVGRDVSTVTVGDRVVSETARKVCGRCALCREGRYNLCQSRVGFGALYDGSMAEEFVSRDALLHKVPDSVPDHAAAVAEPYCVAFTATVERARVRPGDSVIVLGPGPVGAFAAQIALLSGAGDVTVAGIAGDEPRLAILKKWGAKVLVVTDEWWSEPGYASSADVVIDATGVSGTLEAALGVVKAGGQIVKVGWGPEPYTKPLDMLVAKGVDLHGSFSHTWSTWERVLKLLSRGKLDPTDAVKTFEFADWHQGFESMAQRSVLKSVLTL